MRCWLATALVLAVVLGTAWVACSTLATRQDVAEVLAEIRAWRASAEAAADGNREIERLLGLLERR